jgi:hypothetical protein
LGQLASGAGAMAISALFFLDVKGRVLVCHPEALLRQREVGSAGPQGWHQRACHDSRGIPDRLASFIDHDRNR